MTESKDVQLLVTEVHTLQQQLGSVHATLESLVRQQCTLASLIISLQKPEGVVVKEAVSPLVSFSQAHKLFVSPIKNVILLPTPTGVNSDCAEAATPMGAIGQDEPCRVAHGKTQEGKRGVT